MSSKDRHDNLYLQESLQKLEQEEEEGEGEEEEEGGVASRKDDDEDEDEEEEGDKEAVDSRKDDDEDDGEGEGEGEGEEECKTPCSSDYKIPTIQSCPPTPRKKPMRWVNSLNKRKLSEFQFFETTRSEEVESFFRSNSDPFTTTTTTTTITTAVADDADEPRSIKRRRCRSA